MQNFEEKFYNFDDIYYDYPELYYSNGKIISHSKFKHPKNGIIKIHTKSGHVLLEICYKNNKKHGKCTHYFYNSDIVHLIEYYRGNKLHGTTYTYNKKGELIQEETFIDGVKEGTDRVYSENGQYLDELSFKKNKLITKNRYKKLPTKTGIFNGIIAKIHSLLNKESRSIIKNVVILSLITVVTCNISYAKVNFKEGLKSYFQAEDYVSEEDARNKFINDVYLKELDKIYELHQKAFDVDNPKIQSLYEKFKKNKNNMYDNRYLYETAHDFVSDNTKILEAQLKNLYAAHNHYSYTSKYGKYSYFLTFEDKELEQYGIVQIYKLKNMYNEWKKIADEVYKYSYNYETKKRDNFYKNKYNAVYGGDIDILLLDPYKSPKVGQYYTTQMHLNIIQALGGGVLVSSGQASAYGYRPHFKNAYIVTNKSYVTGQNIAGHFQYLGTYSYTTAFGARNTVWKFKEITPPSDTFYFVYK